MNRLLFLLFTGAAACHAQMVSAYLDVAASPTHQVCTMPVEARMMRVGVKGGVHLVEESEVWAAKFESSIRRAIAEAGGEWKTGISTESLKGDEHTRQLVLRIRQKYESISVQMRKKRKDVRKGRYTLGDEIALLPCARDADSIAFVDVEGMVQTGGRKAVSILAGGVFGIAASMSRSRVWISFVDAKSGNIKSLVFVNAMGGKTPKDPEAALNKRLVAAFRRLHVGKAATP